MVFIFILLAILLVTIILMFSKINIQITNFQFSSITVNNRYINKDYKFTIRLYVLGKIPIIKVNITKTKLEKLRLKEKFEQIDIEKIQREEIFNKKFIKVVRNLNLEIKSIKLKIELGTENACLTSIIVPAISTIIAVLIRNRITKYENQTFIVNPVYYNQNLINIKLSGIFEIKLIHIINIIYILNKKRRVKENERASNRRAYDYSYE